MSYMSFSGPITSKYESKLRIKKNFWISKDFVIDATLQRNIF